MVLAPIKDDKTPLPYDKAGQKVDEDAAGHLGMWTLITVKQRPRA